VSGAISNQKKKKKKGTVVCGAKKRDRLCQLQVGGGGCSTLGSWGFRLKNMCWLVRGKTKGNVGQLSNWGGVGGLQEAR